MLRTLPASRQAALSLRRGVQRVPRRRLATEQPLPPTGAGSLPPPPPPAPRKERKIFRRLLIYTTLLTGVFYAGSTVAAFNNERYHDFFVESVPLGEATVEYVEDQGWDRSLRVKWLQGRGDSASEAVARARESVQQQVSKVEAKAKQVKASVTSAAESAADSSRGQKVKEKVKDSVDRLTSVKDTVVTKAQKGTEQASKQTAKAVAIARHQADQVQDTVDDLVRRAEAALAGKPIDALPEATTTPEQPAVSPPDATPPHVNDEGAGNVYSKPLPLGFEAPYGFSQPARPKAATPSKAQTTDAAPEPLPLLAPTVAAFEASEPIITQLASTIDSLAAYLNGNPTAATKARDVLDTAKVDLSSLAERIDKVKAEERAKLEEKLEEQAKDYSTKLVQLEMEAQDVIDNQQEDFRKFHDSEKTKYAQAYREKLEHELRTQSEIINERLKEEVIAQGIEMQRRWIREIKVRVEQERGGRLAKLDDLAASLKRLERITLDNSSYLDDNLRLHALWSSLRTVSAILSSPVRKPFREELRVLRHAALSREDPIMGTALASIEASEVPDVGVEPLADLTTWFTSSVAPRVASVALVPDQAAGVLSHLASHLVSSFQLTRKGLVPGKDVLSVLARAEYHLNEKDLDSAARELNQLSGTAKVLVSDWLDAARRRLEVQQALEVVQAQATLSSLLVV